MRTQLSEFCDQFVHTLDPVLAPLNAALAATERVPEHLGDRGQTQLGLTEMHTQLTLLSDKVAKQRAFVLIFGPLKSGKSTLMNSIAGSYVSEVSSLPAYPSLVFVSHADKSEYVVQSYAGKTSTCSDPSGLTKIIDSAHSDLARALRKAEDEGEQFDPKQHFPAAIQRIDVKIPATNLKESGAVLVDTPGLYTRMRFGYDRMTRDFRNAAACAIFVVKSDTLFLDQVFTEFGQLLELFSRIFLVINMDTTKRDVGPDGTLVPSMEQKSPERIVEAFENLAMPKALREAADDGRLRIFPVDLMNAASLTLKGESVDGTDFGRFRDDLAAYLASTDYLRAFLSDSLKRASHLVADTHELTEGRLTQALRDELANDAEHREALEAELALLADCQKLDWTPAFSRYERELKERLDRTSQDIGSRIARDMSAGLETWMLSTHSLAKLFEEDWLPPIEEYVAAMHDAAERAFEQSVYQSNAGLEFDETLLNFLNRVGVDFRPFRKAAHEEAAATPAKIPTVPVRAEDIPLRRGFVDVLSLRNEAKLRLKLFGPDGTNRITPRQKATRLGEPAKKFINQRLLHFRDEFFPQTIQSLQKRFGQEMREATIARFREALRAREPEIRQEIATLDQRGKDIAGVLTPLETLRTTAEVVNESIKALSDQFAASETGTETKAVLQPQTPTQAAKKSAPAKGRRGKRQRHR